MIIYIIIPFPSLFSYFPSLLLSPLHSSRFTSASLYFYSSFPSTFPSFSLSLLFSLFLLPLPLFMSIFLFFSVDSSLWQDVKSYDEKIQIDTVLPFKDFSVISGREDGLPRIWLLTPGVCFILYLTILYYITLYCILLY